MTFISATTQNENSMLQVPVQFNYEELKKATNDFSDELSGELFGSDFKGILDDGSLVAVRRINGGKYAKMFFEAEISSIGGIRHAYVVPLRGYCIHQLESMGDAFIVYDYFPNGRLHSWIFPAPSRPADRVLSWKLRYQVALDIAKGLIFLHHYCSPQILHMDIKPNNILLDAQFRAVLDAFSLSVQNNPESGVQLDELRGRRGYIVPEMKERQVVTAKYDMYYYGKLLLDLFFGMPYVCLDKDGVDIYERNGNSIREHRKSDAFMRDRLGQHDLMSLADKRLPVRDVNVLQLNCLVHVAVRCIKEDPDHRPRDMREVLRMLEEEEKEDEARESGDERDPEDWTLSAMGQPGEISEFSQASYHGEINDEMMECQGVSSSVTNPSILSGDIKDPMDAKGKLVRLDIHDVKKSDQPETAEHEVIKDFNYLQLLIATKDFDESCILGTGRCGTVFKGFLSEDKTWIAVKRVNTVTYMEKEFLSEISPISNMIHPNIAHLRGHLSIVNNSGRKLYIVNDFFKNGSLDSWIFPGSPDGRRLSWKQRRKIAVDVAEALLFLHRDCPKEIIHLGVKPQNILLGDGLQGVLADLGMSKLQDEDDGDFYTKRTRGRSSYMAPERYSGYRTDKSVDFFSYGRVLLDMFLGKPYICFDQNGENIYDTCGLIPLHERRSLVYLKKMIQENKAMDVIDKNLLGDEGVDERVASCFLNVAIRCLNEDPKKRPQDMSEVHTMLAMCMPELIKDFNYSILHGATKGFHQTHKLGSGGCGTVYKGYLEDDETYVAVKAVIRQDQEAKEFRSEISALSNATHSNLVRLRGHFPDKPKIGMKLFLVYDFFKNGSLDSWIFPQSPKGRFLKWKQRCRIAVDIARALLYLHQGCPNQIIHLDVKPQNILVGDDLRGVLTDFGLSKSLNKNENSIHSLAGGTPGYAAPELYSGYRRDKAVDIYSYGKVLLDMFLGEQFVCFDWDGINIYDRAGHTQQYQQRSLDYLKNKIRKNKVLDVIDERLKGNEGLDEWAARRFLGVAIRCLKNIPEKRPRNMSEVLTTLTELYSHNGQESDEVEIIDPKLISDFNYLQLRTATKDFHKNRMLGYGRCGQIFKGFLKEDKTWIAVRRVEREICGEKEVLNAISAISNLSHTNLVHLRGHCFHKRQTGNKLFLIYEYFQKGSLDSWLFPGSSEGRFLNWKERCRIAKDIAVALSCLHDGFQKIHRNVKPQNILVGDDMRGVLADFSLSKLINKHESTFHAEMTPGYMAPELPFGDGTDKSLDVFSYGKLLMDMFLGQPYLNLDNNGENVELCPEDDPVYRKRSLVYLRKKIQEKKVLDVIDERLIGGEGLEERAAGRFVSVAIRCLREDPDRRPHEMSKVLTMLEPVWNSSMDNEDHDFVADDEDEDDED